MAVRGLLRFRSRAPVLRLPAPLGSRCAGANTSDPSAGPSTLLPVRGSEVVRTRLVTIQGVRPPEGISASTGWGNSGVSILRRIPKHWISDYRSLLAGKDSEALDTGGEAVEIKHEDQRNPSPGRISAHTALSVLPCIAVSMAFGLWPQWKKPQ
jgi:hypothetical protein